MEFRDDQYLENLLAVLDEPGMDAKLLELKLTESVLMTPQGSALFLETVRDLGVQVTIDNFGTGYSSLSYLRQLPDRCTEDRSVVRQSDHCGETGKQHRPRRYQHGPSPRIRRSGRGGGDIGTARLPPGTRMRRGPGLLLPPTRRPGSIRPPTDHTEQRERFGRSGHLGAAVGTLDSRKDPRGVCVPLRDIGPSISNPFINVQDHRRWVWMLLDVRFALARSQHPPPGSRHSCRYSAWDLGRHGGAGDMSAGNGRSPYKEIIPSAAVHGLVAESAKDQGRRRCLRRGHRSLHTQTNRIRSHRKSGGFRRDFPMNSRMSRRTIRRLGRAGCRPSPVPR